MQYLFLQPPKAFLSPEYSQLLDRYSADIMSDNFLGTLSYTGVLYYFPIRAPHERKYFYSAAVIKSKCNFIRFLALESVDLKSIYYYKRVPSLEQCIYTSLYSTVVLLQIAIDEKDGDAKELLKKELWYVMSYCIAQYFEAVKLINLRCRFIQQNFISSILCTVYGKTFIFRQKLKWLFIVAYL